MNFLKLPVLEFAIHDFFLNLFHIWVDLLHCGSCSRQRPSTLAIIHQTWREEEATSRPTKFNFLHKNKQKKTSPELTMQSTVALKKEGKTNFWEQDVYMRVYIPIGARRIVTYIFVMSTQY